MFYNTQIIKKLIGLFVIAILFTGCATTRSVEWIEKHELVFVDSVWFAIENPEAPGTFFPYSQPTNGTFAFAPTPKAYPQDKIKKAIFSQLICNNDVLYHNSQANPDFISIKHDFFGLNRQYFTNISYHCGQE